MLSKTINFARVLSHLDLVGSSYLNERDDRSIMGCLK